MSTLTTPALTAEELLAWNDKTAQNWHKLIDEHPEILAISCDVYGVKSVGQLLQHIVAVETRYAQRLAAIEETPYEAIPCDTGASIFTAHAAAMRAFRTELAKGGDWDAKFEFQTLTMGRARASRKTVLFHALLHGIRHYAQLATLVRQHGFKPAWPMDYLMMGIERAE
jgi:uncharacterized damage-inducible protein DinB